MNFCSKLGARSRKRFLGVLGILLLGSAPLAWSQGSAGGPQTEFPNVLYGAAYYNEYMPQDTPEAQKQRLEKDVALMKGGGPERRAHGRIHVEPVGA